MCNGPTLAACAMAPLTLFFVGVAPFGVVVCLRASMIFFVFVCEWELARPRFCLATTTTAPPSLIVATVVNTSCTPECVMVEAGAVAECPVFVLEWEDALVAGANAC